MIAISANVGYAQSRKELCLSALESYFGRYSGKELTIDERTEYVNIDGLVEQRLDSTIHVFKAQGKWKQVTKSTITVVDAKGKQSVSYDDSEILMTPDTIILAGVDRQTNKARGAVAWLSDIRAESKKRVGNEFFALPITGWLPWNGGNSILDLLREGSPELQDLSTENGPQTLVKLRSAWGTLELLLDESRGSMPIRITQVKSSKSKYNEKALLGNLQSQPLNLLHSGVV